MFSVQCRVMREKLLLQLHTYFSEKFTTYLSNNSQDDTALYQIADNDPTQVVLIKKLIIALYNLEMSCRTLETNDKNSSSYGHNIRMTLSSMSWNIGAIVSGVSSLIYNSNSILINSFSSVHSAWTTIYNNLQILNNTHIELDVLAKNYGRATLLLRVKKMIKAINLHSALPKHEQLVQILQTFADEDLFSGTGVNTVLKISSKLPGYLQQLRAICTAEETRVHLTGPDTSAAEQKRIFDALDTALVALEDAEKHISIGSPLNALQAIARLLHNLPLVVWHNQAIFFKILPLIQMIGTQSEALMDALRDECLVPIVAQSEEAEELLGLNFHILAQPLIEKISQFDETVAYIKLATTFAGRGPVPVVWQQLEKLPNLLDQIAVDYLQPASLQAPVALDLKLSFIRDERVNAALIKARTERLIRAKMVGEDTSVLDAATNFFAWFDNVQHNVESFNASRETLIAHYKMFQAFFAAHAPELDQNIVDVLNAKKHWLHCAQSKIRQLRQPVIASIQQAQAQAQFHVEMIESAINKYDAQIYAAHGNAIILDKDVEPFALGVQVVDLATIEKIYAALVVNNISLHKVTLAVEAFVLFENIVSNAIIPIIYRKEDLQKAYKALQPHILCLDNGNNIDKIWVNALTAKDESILEADKLPVNFLMPLKNLLQEYNDELTHRKDYLNRADSTLKNTTLRKKNLVAVGGHFENATILGKIKALHLSETLDDFVYNTIYPYLYKNLDEEIFAQLPRCLDNFPIAPQYLEPGDLYKSFLQTFRQRAPKIAAYIPLPLNKLDNYDVWLYEKILSAFHSVIPAISDIMLLVNNKTASADIRFYQALLRALYNMSWSLKRLEALDENIQSTFFITEVITTLVIVAFHFLSSVLCVVVISENPFLRTVWDDLQKILQTIPYIRDFLALAPRPEHEGARDGIVKAIHKLSIQIRRTRRVSFVTAVTDELDMARQERNADEFLDALAKIYIPVDGHSRVIANVADLLNDFYEQLKLVASETQSVILNPEEEYIDRFGAKLFSILDTLEFDFGHKAGALTEHLATKYHAFKHVLLKTLPFKDANKRLACQLTDKTFFDLRLQDERARRNILMENYAMSIAASERAIKKINGANFISPDDYSFMPDVFLETYAEIQPVLERLDASFRADYFINPERSNNYMLISCDKMTKLLQERLKIQLELQTQESNRSTRRINYLLKQSEEQWHKDTITQTLYFDNMIEKYLEEAVKDLDLGDYRTWFHDSVIRDISANKEEYILDIRRSNFSASVTALPATIEATARDLLADYAPLKQKCISLAKYAHDIKDLKAKTGPNNLCYQQKQEFLFRFEQIINKDPLDDILSLTEEVAAAPAVIALCATYDDMISAYDILEKMHAHIFALKNSNSVTNQAKLKEINALLRTLSVADENPGIRLQKVAERAFSDEFKTLFLKHDDNILYELVRWLCAVLLSWKSQDELAVIAIENKLRFYRVPKLVTLPSASDSTISIFVQ